MNRFDQPFSPRRFLLAFLISAALAAPGLTRANPVDPVVTHGAATFDQVGGQLTINQLTDRAVIDWQSFSISADEITQFVQPGTTSAVLNRVRGNAASFIDGQLLANGRVFLLNSNGILIGPNGYIDTAGFVASTLDVDSDEFMRGGDLHFRGTSNASVVNLGTIKASAGDVVLIGANVRNSGTILAPRGTVALAGGQDVILMATGDSRIKVRTGKGVVINQGVIAANRAELEAHHGNVGALAIRNDGRIAATGVTKQGGRIYLSAGGKGKIKNTGTLKARVQPKVEAKPEIRIEADEVEAGGTIDASSETNAGGYIAVQAREVLVPSGTVVLADGETGGGQINIGGGLRGSDPELRNATRVVVEENSEISVDAHRISNGGIAVVFAEGRLDFNGRVSATGGIQGGNGGFVELSGREQVHLSNLSEQVKIGAPNGQSGTLLLDPIDITITSGVNDGIVAGTSITDGSIINFLENSGNLIIDSSGGGGGTQTLNEFDNDPMAANIQAPGHQSSSSIIADGSPFSTFSPFTFNPGSATGNPNWPHQLFAVPSTVNTTLSGAGTVTLLVNGTDGTVYYGVGPVPNVVGTAGLVRIDDGPANVTFTPGETAFIYYDIRNTTNGPTTYAELTAGQLFGNGVNDILQLTEAGGGGNGDITINSGADITWTSSNSLTFNASGSFQNNGSISGAGDLVVTAADFDNSGIIDGIGSVTVTAPRTVALNEYIRGSSVVINAIDLGDGVSMVVDTTADVVDGTTASSTALLYDSGGQISLREAFLASNNDSLHNEIGFSPGLDGSPILLSIGAELEDAAAEGDLDVSSAINGSAIRLSGRPDEDLAASGDLDVINGSTITLNGNGLSNTIIEAGPDMASATDRVFDLRPGGGATLELNNLTVRNGNGPSGGGGLVRNQGTLRATNSLFTGGTAPGDGGAIASSLDLELTNSTVSNSSSGTGGGIRVSGSASIENSTLSGNTASANGGGIASLGVGTVLSLTNTTLSGNTASSGGGLSDTSSGGSTFVTNATITGNNGGGVHTTSGSTQLDNTIVAGNPGGDILGGSIAANSFNNLIGDAATSGGLINGVSGNIVGNEGSGSMAIASILNPTLANNGGSTLTHALVDFSHAINTGDNTVASDLTTDQTGASRVLEAIVDIGAVESSGLQMPLPPQPEIPEEVVEEVIEEAINTVDATSDTETTETDTGTETGGMTTDTNIGSETNNFTQSETGDGAPAAEGAATPESLMGQGDGGEGAATPAGGGEGAQSAGTTEGGETGDGGGTGGGETPAEGGSEGDGSTTGDGEGESEGSSEGEGGEGEGNMESDSADGDGAQGEGTQGEGSGGDGTRTDGGAAAGTGEGGTVETDNSTDGVFPSAEAPTTPPETVTPPQSSEQNPVVSISGGIPKPETEAAMTQSTQPGVEMALDAAVGGEGQADIGSTDGGISIGTESVEPPAPVTTQALDQNTGYQAMSEFDQAFGGDGSFDVPSTSNSPAPMSFDDPPPSPQVASSIVNAVDPAAASNMARSFGFQGTVPVDPGAGATGVTPQDFMSNPATQQALENSTSPDAQQEMVDAMNSLLE